MHEKQAIVFKYRFSWSVLLPKNANFNFPYIINVYKIPVLLDSKHPDLACMKAVISNNHPCGNLHFLNVVLWQG